MARAHHVLTQTHRMVQRLDLPDDHLSHRQNTRPPLRNTLLAPLQSW
jgi:hypothetical protein